MSELPSGSVISGLRVEGIAGAGGTSTVYEVIDVGTSERAALKIIPGPHTPSQQRKFAREAALLQQATHPGIVGFRSFEQVGDDFHLVTGWVEGETLRAYLDTHAPLPADEALSMVGQLGAALDALHAQGIVHRDITPANLMVAPDGRLVIIDLGIGHEVDTTTMTNADLLAGTPQYVAPEIVRGQPGTAQSDQYSVGLIMYEMLTGVRPFERAADGSGSLATALHDQLHTVPEPVNERNPSVPDSLATAVERALAKDPAARFDSLAHLMHAARPVTSRPSISAGASPDSTSDAKGARQRWALAALGALGLLAWGAIGLFSNDPPTSISGPWVSGSASQLDCNLLDEADFESGGLGVDWFGVPPGVEQVLDHGGVDNSNVLQAGQAGQYSQYAERVPVLPGTDYLFRGWFRVSGEVATADMGITFQDADNNALANQVVHSVESLDGSYLEVDAVAPVGAVSAVPYVYKDSSADVLFADELVFGPAMSCRPQIAALQRTLELESSGGN